MLPFFYGGHFKYSVPLYHADSRITLIQAYDKRRETRFI